MIEHTVRLLAFARGVILVLVLMEFKGKPPIKCECGHVLLNTCRYCTRLNQLRLLIIVPDKLLCQDFGHKGHNKNKNCDLSIKQRVKFVLTLHRPLGWLFYTEFATLSKRAVPSVWDLVFCRRSRKWHTHAFE